MIKCLHTHANTVFNDATQRSSFALVTAPTGRILLLQKNDPDSSEHGRFELPGGGLDEDESFRKGALREVYEETGFRGSQVYPVKGLKHHGKRGPTELMMFIAPAEEEFTPEIAHNPVTGKLEHTGHLWLTLDEIINRDDIHSKQQGDMRENAHEIRSLMHKNVEASAASPHRDAL